MRIIEPNAAPVRLLAGDSGNFSELLCSAFPDVDQDDLADIRANAVLLWNTSPLYLVSYTLESRLCREHGRFRVDSFTEWPLFLATERRLSVPSQPPPSVALAAGAFRLMAAGAVPRTIPRALVTFLEPIPGIRMTQSDMADLAIRLDLAILENGNLFGADRFGCAAERQAELDARYDLAFGVMEQVRNAATESDLLNYIGSHILSHPPQPFDGADNTYWHWHCRLADQLLKTHNARGVEAVVTLANFWLLPRRVMITRTSEG